MKIASELSKLYTLIIAKPQFITLEPMMARNEVIEMIADVIHKAEELKPQLEKTVADIIEYYNEKPPILTEFDRA
jgi:hypothetical protein